VRRAVTPTLAELLSSLRRTAPEQRLALLRARSPAGTWLRDLAEALLATPDEDTRVAALNDALIDLDHALRQGAAWPRSGLRLALASAGLCSVLAFVLGATSIVPWLLGLGGIAAIVCARADRRARALADAQRRDVDALVLLLAGPLPPSPRPRRHARARPGATGP